MEFEGEAEVGVEAGVTKVGVEPHLCEDGEVIQEDDELAGRLNGLVPRRIDNDTQMLVLEPSSLLVGDEDGNISVVTDVLLGFGPGRLDGDEDVVLAEDFARLIVELLVDAH